MPRRKLYRRSIAPLTADQRKKYLLTLPRRDLYAHPQSMPPITSRSLFANDRPLEVEIGCGSGEFLCGLADQHPLVNFVGVEIRSRALHEAVAQAAAMALDNIRFVHTDARLLYPLLAPGSLRAVYLHFPDPNDRPKYRNRRVFTERFLDAMHDAMTCDGTLSVMTDHEGAFAEMLDLVERDQRWRKTHHERFLEGYEVESKSRFQRIWEGHGMTTLRFEVTKGDIAA